MLRWKRHITKIDKDRHICYTEQKIGEDVMYKIVICDDDKNFISYMKEMLLRCGLSERQVTFYEERRSKKNGQYQQFAQSNNY